MTLSLPPDLEQRVKTEIALGGFQDPGQLVEEAVAEFLDARRANRRMEAIRRIGDAVDAAGLYDQVCLPSNDD